MHSIALLLLLTSASGQSASVGSGVPVTLGVMGGDFSSAAVGEVRGTLVSPRAGTITTLHWEINTPGTNGAGSTFTLAFTGDGVALCSAEVACTASTTGSAACAADFAQGVDLHIVVTASACTTLPRFVSSATWLW